MANKANRPISMASCAAIGLLAGGPAWAENAPPAPAQAATPAAGPQDAEPGDIIVTAQRRSELARDVPISLTALSGDQLAAAGVTDTTALAQLTPGLKMDRVGNFTLPAIRGVTTTVTGPAADANVAIYLDGVYQPSTTANTFDLPDVERVEVLKGPQGTLFGRNATGGAIQVFTKEPSYQPTGAATLSYGNYNDFVAKGFVSAPIVKDVVAVSLAGYYHSNDSYYHNIREDGPPLTGAKEYLFRGKLRFDPTDTLKITLIGSYTDRTESNAIYGSALNGNTVTRLLDPNAIIPTKPYEVAFNDQIRPQHIKAWDIAGKIELEALGGKITSLSAYNNYDLNNVLDADYAYATNGLGVNYHVSTNDHYFSQETSYASAWTGPLNFVIGAFYTNGEGSWNPLGVETPAYSVSIYGTQKVESAAGFGELYYNLTSKLSLIGGLRYSWEKRQELGNTLFGLGVPPPTTLTPVGQKSWTSLTPRASIRYAFADRNNVYFTYSQGFKSGVYNTSNTSSPDLANPEKVRAYELGYKGRVAPGFEVSAAGFYYDYTNLQASVLTSVNGIPLSLLRNAATARIYGLEGDATMRFSGAFDLRAAVSLLDAKYSSFAAASVNVPCTNIPAAGETCSTVGTPTNTGNASVAYDASGKQMIRAPKFSGSLTASGHADVAGGKLDLSATAYYSSTVYFTFDHRIKQPGYATLDARLSWSPGDSGLSFAVFGKNLTDKATIGGTFVTEVADGVSYTPPRTYGVQVDFRF